MDICIINGIPFETYKPAEVKKAATGKGNSPKPIVQRCIAALFGLRTVEPDEADALAVGLCDANFLEAERLKLIPVDPNAGTFWAQKQAQQGEGN